MSHTGWELVPDGISLREFQATLVNANLAIDKNSRGIYVTTADAEVILGYLTRLLENLSTNIYKSVIEQMNLCQIASGMHEAPECYVRAYGENNSLYIRAWLEAKTEMMSSALHQEYPGAQTATIRFLSAWHQTVSDNYLN